MDLRQSVILALKNNYRVQVDTLDVAVADQNVRKEKAAFDPFIGGQATNFRQSGYSGQYTQGEGLYQSAYVGGKLPTGTSYEVDGYSFRLKDVSVNQERQTGVTVTVRQNLMQGLGLAANLAPIRVAAKNAAISRQAFRQEVSELVADVQEAYFDIVLARENARVAKESFDLATRLFEENKRRAALGSMAGSDIFQAQSEVAARKENLYEAERLLGDAQNNFRLLLSGEAAQAVTVMKIDLTPLPTPQLVKVDARNDFTTALAKRPDYQQAVLGLERDQIDALRASNAALPDLEAFVQGSFSGADRDLNQSWNRVRADDEKPDYAMGLSLKYDIGNRAANADKIAARKHARKSEVTLRHLERQIAVDLDDAARRIDCDWNRLAMARESRELAQESLRAEQKLYDTGNSSTFVLLRLQTDLMDAQLRELSAENDYRKSIVDYQLKLGTMLDAYDIVMP